MVQMSGTPQMVALVQSAITLPFMFFALPSGALADMVDRRTLMLGAQATMSLIACALTLLTWTGMAGPFVLLAFCFAIGCGTAVYLPAMQASIPDQVPRPAVPAAMAFNSISANLGRSLGPAIGGAMVSMGGAVAAFALNTVCAAGLTITLLHWHPAPAEHGAPRSDIVQALKAGLHFIVGSSPIVNVLARSTLFALFGSAPWALLPLVARDLLGGGPFTLGMLLGALGTGALSGALTTAPIRRRLDPERVVRMGSIGFGISIIVVAFSPRIFITMAALGITGWGWTLSMVSFNTSVQLAAPRWVAGRVLAGFQAGVYGAMAVGSWACGAAVGLYGLPSVLAISGTLMILAPLIGLRLRIPS
jgi:MFS family permease